MAQFQDAWDMSEASNDDFSDESSVVHSGTASQPADDVSVQAGEAELPVNLSGEDTMQPHRRGPYKKIAECERQLIIDNYVGMPYADFRLICRFAASLNARWPKFSRCLSAPL
jgi:hypothetical protein